MYVGPGAAKAANDDIEMESKYETDAKFNK
jgi:hypothetical protein